MTHFAGTFIGTQGYTLYEQTWLPTESARGHVVLVHGYGDHSGRYARMAFHFIEKGLALYTFDLRGHGRSPGRRAFIPSFDTYADDLALFLKHVAPRIQNGPVFLLGHSMGGAIAAYYCLKHRPHLTGLLLSSPAIIFGENVPAFIRTLSGVISRIAPSLPTVKLNLNDLSRDPAVVEAARKDPLYYRGRMPSRTGSEMLRVAAYVRDHASELRLPLLLLHGTADRITSPSGSRYLHEHAGASDKTLRLFDGFYHETFNDPGGASVLNVMSQWMIERI
jgi:acylglycerol lipase